MPVVVETPTTTIVWYRQPWFWAVVIAVMAILVFGIVIAASGPGRTPQDTNTIIQQPAPSQPSVAAPVPVPAPNTPPTSSITPPPAASPLAAPQPPMPAAAPAKEKIVVRPKVIHEKEKVIVREKVLVPAPAPSGANPDTFQSTGLPNTLRFGDGDWKAGRVTMVTPEKLKDAGTSDDGQQLMVSINAQEPYTTVLVAVPGQDGKYVEYRKQ